MAGLHHLESPVYWQELRNSTSTMVAGGHGSRLRCSTIYPTLRYWRTCLVRHAKVSGQCQASMVECRELTISQGKHKAHETVDTDHIHEPADVPAHDE